MAGIGMAGLPLDCSEWTAYGRFLMLLQSDPTLKRTVATWILGDSPDFNLNFEPPSPDMLPWARLTPRGESFRRMPLRTFDQTISVLLELAVPGASARDRWRYWQAWRRAIFCPDDARQDAFNKALRDVGIREVRITRPGFAPDLVTDSGVVVSQAMVELLLTVEG